MKKFTLTFVILCAFCALAYTGTERYSGKEVMQQAPPVVEWYRAHEWDLMIWGTYAISGNPGRDDFELGPLINDKRINNFGGSKEDAIDQDIGQTVHDRFLDRDGAWGGGADVKYFFSKYWALGAEGFVVDANDNIGGAGLGTFTFRWPIGQSRFAPYAFAGGGVLAGGSHNVAFFNDIHTAGEESGGDEEDLEFIEERSIQNKHAEAIGQFGAGLEIRVTRHVGMMGDFAWNMVSGPNNNFGMARFGLTLSY
jgi:hypothetical protein